MKPRFNFGSVTRVGLFCKYTVNAKPAAAQHLRTQLHICFPPLPLRLGWLHPAGSVAWHPWHPALCARASSLCVRARPVCVLTCVEGQL